MRLRFGIIPDAHLATSSAKPYDWQNTVDLPHSRELVDAGLRWLAEQQLDALVLLGDLTETADPASFAAVTERATTLGIPVLAVPGNCDVDPNDRTLTAFQSFAGPTITLAPTTLHMPGSPAVELVGLVSNQESNRLRGVRAHTQAGAPDLVLTHYPVLDLEADLLAAGFRHSGNLTNRAEIEAELRSRDRPVVVIHGHLHIHDARISRNLLHLSCAALIEPPHHVSVIEMTDTPDHMAVERWAHVAREDAVERLPVFAPAHQRWRWHDGGWREQPVS